MAMRRYMAIHTFHSEDDVLFANAADGTPPAIAVCVSYLTSQCAPPNKLC